MLVTGPTHVAGAHGRRNQTRGVIMDHSDCQKARSARDVDDMQANINNLHKVASSDRWVIMATSLTRATHVEPLPARGPFAQNERCSMRLKTWGRDTQSKIVFLLKFVCIYKRQGLLLYSCSFLRKMVRVDIQSERGYFFPMDGHVQALSGKIAGKDCITKFRMSAVDPLKSEMG